jgi:hypothetical protein
MAGINHVQNLQRIRENQQNQNMPRPGIGPAQLAAMRNMRNGMMNGEMHKAAMSKSL